MVFLPFTLCGGNSVGPFTIKMLMLNSCYWLYLIIVSLFCPFLLPFATQIQLDLIFSID